MKEIKNERLCHNPYFNGIILAILRIRKTRGYSRPVTILILME